LLLLSEFHELYTQLPFRTDAGINVFYQGWTTPCILSPL